MSAATFITSQRAEHDVPAALACRALSVSTSRYYKSRERLPTPGRRRHADLVEAVWASFEVSGFTYGSPRVWLDLHEDGWRTRWRADLEEHRRAGDARQRLGRQGPPVPAAVADRQGTRLAAPDLVRPGSSRPARMSCGAAT